MIEAVPKAQQKTTQVSYTESHIETTLKIMCKIERYV